MEELLKVNDLDYSYPNKEIFNNLHFSIKKESMNLILGTNSSGKTTLIYLLSGILPSHDSIELDGILLNHENLKKYLLMIGVVFFDNNNKFLFDKVTDELTFPLENLNYKRNDILKRVREVTNLLDLNNCINKKIKDLTNYEQVKVLIATSIMHKPKVIFLDSILDKLNSNECKKIFKLLEKIKKNTSICITSSNLDNILYFDNVLILGDKTIKIKGAPKEVLQQDNELAKLGFIIPQMIDLSLKLNFYGVLDEIITDVDGMVDKLWK